MTKPTEETLVELPAQAYLHDLGYRIIDPAEHAELRAGPNEVIFTPLLVAALQKLNDIDKPTARSIAAELAGLTDNRAWLGRLRNDLSKKPPGEPEHRTMRLVDYDDPDRNDFAVTRQLRVEGAANRVADLVVYLNGIPIVVIELKSPLNPKQNTFDAIIQIEGMAHDVPRLFHPNLFNIASDDMTFRFGATGAPREFWSDWRDPWPKARGDFADATERGLYALLEPRRLLDILAHFIVFETRGDKTGKTKTIKKVCRHQQYRAVARMAQRVIDGEHRAGLVWHTQGSGKSLTMCFAAMKLKFHRGTDSPRLTNPNLLVVTDRVALHTQITDTFRAVGIRNVIAVAGVERPRDAEGRPIHPTGPGPHPVYLAEAITAHAMGKVVLSTIFKFHQGDDRLTRGTEAERKAALRDLAVPGSENWIVMVDECHRTQEKDLGAYLRAILPHAIRFGFTGTPVKKGDLDTFRNFGISGEAYLDKYGIDDAVADGATVPVYYQARKTEWHLHDKELDVIFDQVFAHLPDGHIEELKKRGVTRGDLARLEQRIDLIALDLWTHYRTHIKPDGFKGQVVAIDRRACVAYKRALDRVIAQWLADDEGLAPEAAEVRAGAMSVCIYSPAQNDREKYPEVAELQLDELATREAVKRFEDPDDPLCLLIVCNKLLTGFDAPIEQVMYLDNPLTDHNLLQAIARTNRRSGPRKERGIVVDYIGVSKSLGAALAAYRSEDVAGALRDHELLAGQLAAAHRECMELVRQVPLNPDPKQDAQDILDHLGTLDRWFLFRGKVDAFTRAYQGLAPDPRVLVYRGDLTRVAAAVPYGRLRFEHAEGDVDWRQYSAKVRDMLRQHLQVTGLATLCKLRDLSDPEFMADFEDPADLRMAAVRKLSELKKITRERAAKDPARYGKFSERVRQLIHDFDKGLISAREVLDGALEVVGGVKGEDLAHTGSGLTARAYSIAMILRSFAPEGAAAQGSPLAPGVPAGGGLSPVGEVAAAIDALYAEAPLLWHEREQLRKDLRGEVRRLVKPLGLDGWAKQIPNAVEAFAVQHHARRPGGA